MNLNITGIYDNTVIVDNNLFEDVRLLQTGLSSLSDTLFNVVEGLPNQYANLTTFTNLSNNYDTFKINNTSNLSNINSDIDNNFVNNTTLSTLSTAIDEQFELTTTYIDDKITEQQEYTDQEIEALRVEGYIQEALTQAAAWITSDEGKRFRKKVWDKIKSKWASFTGNRQYTEFLNDASYATAEELDEMLKVYRYDGLAAGIRCDAITGKDIVMNGNTYIYSGNLFLTGNINKGTFNSSTGTWTQQELLNDYFVMKGVKNNNGLSIDTTTKLLEYKLNSDYFNINASNQLSPVFELKGIKTNNFLKVDSTTKLLEIMFNSHHLINDSLGKLMTRLNGNGGLINNSAGTSINLADNSLSLSTSGLQLNIGSGLMTSINGVAVKLSDTSLDVSNPPLAFNLKFNSLLPPIKN